MPQDEEDYCMQSLLTTIAKINLRKQAACSGRHMNAYANFGPNSLQIII